MKKEVELMANLGESVQEAKDLLLMLSGGRDSFLSACRLIEQGYRVHMVTYDNGCMSNTCDAKAVADRIITKYGSSRALFIGVRSVAANLYRLQEPYLYKTIGESRKNYPHLRPAQLPCLACHTGMYLESIAYCRVHDIPYMAEGARKSQKFFVELPEMVKRYKMLAEKNGISLILPVYHLASDWDRKLELADRGYVPKTLEPQCWIGCPLKTDLSSYEIDSLGDYYDNEMEPRLQSLIDERIKACSYEGQQGWEGHETYIEV